MSDYRGSEYWRATHFPRRRVLRGAAIGAAGIGLAACASPAVTTNAPTSVAPTPGQAAIAPAATASGGGPTATPKPKYGGTFKGMATSAEANLEPHFQALTTINALGALICYNKLVTYKSGPNFPPPSNVVGPDLAESWEQPDDL